MTATATAHTAAPEILVWSDEFLLGHSSIDSCHAEFVQLLEVLQRSEEHALAQHLPALIAHLQAHFGSEDQLMESTQFPPRDCHIKEHAAVLKSVLEMQARLQQAADQGDAQELELAQVRCRELVDALVQWFPAHTQHLDSALAHWLAKQNLGGKPIIIKRGLNLR